MHRLSVQIGLLMVVLTAPCVGQESFQVTLNQDGETIADMRPVFLQFESEAMPAISPREVARRYQRLFDQSDEPEVRVDALNRLANLQQVAGEDLRFSPEKEQAVYEEVLGSYDEILARGAFQGRLDELMYQMAKAHALVGQGDRSIQRLKQLVGLYPNSPLVPEARFRIAESAFSAASYQEAEAAYLQVLAGDSRTSDSLKSKARYMLGWSQYKQGAYQRAGETFIAVLDEQAELTDDFLSIPSASTDLIDDTFRIIAIMTGRSGGSRELTALLDRVGTRAYQYLMFDRLADYYVSGGDIEAGVAISQGFIDRYPDHAQVPAFREQVVEVLADHGEPERARVARAQYVEAYANQRDYTALPSDYQQRWLEYARGLADYHYQQASASQDSVRSSAEFGLAAGYYAQLAGQSDSDGEVHRLAGDAWLQAGDYAKAHSHYLKAAYTSDGYEHGADAAWAALTLEAQALDGAFALATELEDYAASAERYQTRFTGDARIPELQADVANRLAASGRFEEARRFALQVVGAEAAGAQYQYSAWLVIGRSESELDDYAAAERAWRQSLALADNAAVVVTPGQRDAIASQLATSIYRQGEQSEQAGEVDLAVAHFSRIETVVPFSDLAVRGRFDAANTLLKASRWQPAINELQRFRQDYPGHPLADEVGSKLVYAYQSSNQPVRAGDELVRMSGDADVGWQMRLSAADFYHQGGAVAQRNDIYLAYLGAAPLVASAQDHVRLQQVRQRLIEDDVNAPELRATLVRDELASDWHSDETLQWAATAALTLGEQAGSRFSTIELTHPLAQSLNRKQQALEAAVGYYRQASTLGGEAARSESLYRRGELYRTLARDLMASSRPEGLSELEAMQYDILLEEQAYPFEEMAIELHVRNHQLLAEGYFDDWVQRSLAVLGELHPGRYARDMRWMSWDEATDGQMEGKPDEDDA